MVTETKPTVYKQAPLMTQSKAMYLNTDCTKCTENKSCWNLKILNLCTENGVKVDKIHCPKGEFERK